MPAARKTVARPSADVTAASLPYRRVRPIFADQLGMPRSKYLPTSTLGEGAEHGTGHCVALIAQHYDFQMTGETPSAQFETGMPDMESRFQLADVRPGWDDGVGVVTTDLWYHGELVEWMPRTILRRAIERWHGLGLEPYVGIEFEAYLMEPDAAAPGGFRPISTPGGFTYGVGSFLDPAGVIEEIMDTALRCGLPLESVNSEYDTPQWELTLQYQSAMRAVDDAFLFRTMAQEVARKRGYHLTFIGKPIAAKSGSGLHVNLSARTKDAKAANAFADPKAEHGVSALALQAVAGLVARHESMSAICAPTVNAYKRLKPGQLSGYWANWGFDHRSVTVRIPHARGAGTRVEHRLADGAANPYLTVAATLNAAYLGIANRMPTPDRETGDSLGEAGSTARHTPANLGEALDAYEADTEFASTMGDEFSANFLAVKRDEWRKFCEHVTDWELATYLPFH
jgi:glutamine synthetase